MNPTQTQPTPDEPRQTEHTPTPWTTEAREISDHNGYPSGCIVHDIFANDDGDKAKLAEVWSYRFFRQTAGINAANAAVIVEAANSHASHLARIAALERALLETTNELATLIKGEHDDPSVGIVGWNSLHQLVEDNHATLSARLALAPAAGKP